MDVALVSAGDSVADSGRDGPRAAVHAGGNAICGYRQVSPSPDAVSDVHDAGRLSNAERWMGRGNVQDKPHYTPDPDDSGLDDRVFTGLFNNIFPGQWTGCRPAPGGLGGIPGSHADPDRTDECLSRHT